MKNSTISKVLCTAVIGLAASASVMANPAITSETSYGETVVTTSAEGLRTATVSYADLDLNTDKARETLHYRLSYAAHKVCGSTERSDAGSLAQASKNRSCYNDAMDEAMSNVSNGQVAIVSR